MKETLLYADLSWKEMAEAVASQRIVILPIGSTEQHGPHLPLCTDDYMAQRWAFESARLAKESFGVQSLVMPGLHYGNAQHHMGFTGTVSLSFETLKNITVEIGKSVLSHGFRKLVLLNVHGGNRYAVRAAAVELGMAQGNGGLPLYIRVVEDCDPDINPLKLDYDKLKGFTEEASLGSMVHGGALETSKMVYLRSDLVDLNRIQEKPASSRGSTREVFPYHILTPTGAMGNPLEATKEAGKVLWEALVLHFAEYLRELSKKP